MCQARPAKLTGDENPYVISGLHEVTGWPPVAAGGHVTSHGLRSRFCRMGRWCTTKASASGAATACGRAPGGALGRLGFAGPKIHKCTHCADRCDQPAPSARNGLTLTAAESQQFRDTIQVPACVKACPADALRYGDREDMLQEARKRIAAKPDKYVDHIYGEKEAAGRRCSTCRRCRSTSWDSGRGRKGYRRIHERRCTRFHPP